MIPQFNLSLVLLCALLARNAVSHPGHDPAEEIAERAEYLNQASRRSLAHCAESLKTRGIHKRAHARRSALAQNLRQKRGLSSGISCLKESIGRGTDCGS